MNVEYSPQETRFAFNSSELLELRSESGYFRQCRRPTYYLAHADRVGATPSLRYFRSMTVRLEEALKRVEALSQEEQDAIASQILETLDDEEAWARKFRARPDLLQSLANEALAEHRRGETRPLDELIG